MEASRKERKIAGPVEAAELSRKDENGSAHDVADERGSRTAEADAALELWPSMGAHHTSPRHLPGIPREPIGFAL